MGWGLRIKKFDIGLLIMLHLLLVYLNIVAIFLPYQEDICIIGENHIDFLKEFDLGIRTSDYTYTYHKVLVNLSVCLLVDNFQH